MSDLSGSLSGDGRVFSAVAGNLLQKPDLPRECMRAVEDCYRLTVCLGSPRLKAWRDTAHGGSVELPALHGAGSAIEAGLLAVSVVLFGQGRGLGWPLLRKAKVDLGAKEQKHEETSGGRECKRHKEG